MSACTNADGQHYWQLLDRKTTGDTSTETVRYYCAHCRTIEATILDGLGAGINQPVDQQPPDDPPITPTDQAADATPDTKP